MRELGVSGRHAEPAMKIKAGTAAPPRLSRHPQPPSILANKKLRTLAARIPIVIDSWKPMLSAPLYLYGAVSER
ncbi:hypothetical protein RHMOL_Rhmol07G0168000 [Rhododendron molle]|uniref:Uncharacterized protein n=1 Tax=Rhododendron molle TaxID=49168 RepID=A0ACC0N1T7_RHOML|nr:hypothetical protein RHMOL_Rhmol07G0168000 [Rhododendron molle]